LPAFVPVSRSVLRFLPATSASSHQASLHGRHAPFEPQQLLVSTPNSIHVSGLVGGLV